MFPDLDNAPVPSARIYEGIGLRSISKEDLPTLHRWRDELAGFELLRPPEKVSSFEEYASWITQVLERTITYLVVTSDSEEAVGLVQAYDVNWWDGYCCALTYVSEGWRGKRVGLEASVAFWDCLFGWMHFRKIYLDVAEFNRSWLEVIPITEVGFTVIEGRFKDHVWHQGRPWNLTRYTLYDEKFLEFRDLAFLLLAHAGHPRSDVGAQQRPQQAKEERQRTRFKLTRARTSLSSNGAGRSHLVETYMRFRASGEVDEIMPLLADDITYENPITGLVTGKEPVSNVLRFGSRILDRSSALDTHADRIQWRAPVEEDGIIRFRGAHPRGTIELEYGIDSSNRIRSISTRGDTEVIAAYLRGDIPLGETMQGLRRGSGTDG
jgi:RimJ/RimL family protein N-acetyltransferase